MSKVLKLFVGRCFQRNELSTEKERKKKQASNDEAQEEVAAVVVSAHRIQDKRMPSQTVFHFFFLQCAPPFFSCYSYSVLAYNTSAAWPFNNSNCFHATESRLHTRRRRTSTMGRFLEHRMPRTLMGESHFASVLRYRWIEIAHTRRGRAVIIGAHTRPTRQFESIPCSTVQNYNSYIIRCRQYKQQQQWIANTNKRSQTDMAILRLQTFPIK